jgi:hypothetical protein
MISRRSILTGLAAPVIIKASRLMPVRGIIMPTIPVADTVTLTWPDTIIYFRVVSIFNNEFNNSRGDK